MVEVLETEHKTVKFLFVFFKIYFIFLVYNIDKIDKILIKLQNINTITNFFYIILLYNLFIHISDITYTLKICDIILQHKEKFVWNIYQT